MKFSVRTKDNSFRETIEAATFDEAARKALRKIYHKRLSVLRTTGESKMDGWFQGYTNVSPGCNSSYGSAVLVEEYVVGARVRGPTRTEAERQAKGQRLLQVRLGAEDARLLKQLPLPGESEPDAVRRAIRSTVAAQIAEKSSAYEKSTDSPK